MEIPHYASRFSSDVPTEATANNAFRIELKAQLCRQMTPGSCPIRGAVELSEGDESGEMRTKNSNCRSIVCGPSARLSHFLFEMGGQDGLNISVLSC